MHFVKENGDLRLKKGFANFGGSVVENKETKG